MKKRHDRGAKIVNYNEGDVVLVAAPDVKKNKKKPDPEKGYYPYNATIVRVHRNNSSVVLRWIGQGPRAEDIHGSECTYAVVNLKRNPNAFVPSEELGTLFEVPLSFFQAE